VPRKESKNTLQIVEKSEKNKKNKTKTKLGPNVIKLYPKNISQKLGEVFLTEYSFKLS
jgi:hypothetical protein